MKRKTLTSISTRPRAAASSPQHSRTANRRQSRKLSAAVVLLLLLVASAAQADGPLLIINNGDCTAPLDISKRTTFMSGGSLRVNTTAPVTCESVIIDPPPDGCEVEFPNVTWSNPSAERNNVEIIAGPGVDSFADFFGPWPLSDENQSSVYRFGIPALRTLSLEFTIPDGDLSIFSMSWEGSPTVSRGSAVSVSSCEAGVLTPISESCLVFGGQTGGNLSIGDGSTCDPGVGTWFLNVADVDSLGLNTCDAPPCEFLLQVSGIKRP